MHERFIASGRLFFNDKGAQLPAPPTVAHGSPSPLRGERAGVRGEGVATKRIDSGHFRASPLTLNPSPLRGAREGCITPLAQLTVPSSCAHHKARRNLSFDLFRQFSNVRSCNPLTPPRPRLWLRRPGSGDWPLAREFWRLVSPLLGYRERAPSAPAARPSPASSASSAWSRCSPRTCARSTGGRSAGASPCRSSWRCSCSRSPLVNDVFEAAKAVVVKLHRLLGQGRRIRLRQSRAARATSRLNPGQGIPVHVRLQGAAADPVRLGVLHRALPFGILQWMRAADGPRAWSTSWAPAAPRRSRCRPTSSWARPRRRSSSSRTCRA